MPMHMLIHLPMHLSMHTELGDGKVHVYIHVCTHVYAYIYTHGSSSSMQQSSVTSRRSTISRMYATATHAANGWHSTDTKSMWLTNGHEIYMARTLTPNLYGSQMDTKSIWLAH